MPIETDYSVSVQFVNMLILSRYYYACRGVQGRIKGFRVTKLINSKTKHNLHTVKYLSTSPTG
jgi:hypothetical protein